jgi:hypothetical protein
MRAGPGSSPSEKFDNIKAGSTLAPYSRGIKRFLTPTKIFSYRLVCYPLRQNAFFAVSCRKHIKPVDAA